MEKDKVEVEENNKPQAEVTEKQSVSKTILDNTSEMEKLREENMKLKNENQWYDYLQKNGSEIPNENKPIIKELNRGMKGSFEENMTSINKKFPNLFKKSNKSFTVIDKGNTSSEKPKSEEKRNAELASKIINRK